jgi:tetratricopeptide (TPR) repeat protein
MKRHPNFHVAQAPKLLAQTQRPDRSNPTALLAEALALHQAGRLDDAEKIYKRILGARPDHFDSLHLLGVIFFQRGNYAKAVRQIDLALKRDANNVFALNNRGNALSEIKRFDEALASYDRALELRPDYVEAHSNRGNALKGLNRFDEALESYDRALRLRPDYAEAHSNRSDALHRLKRFDEALASHDRALSLRPDYAEAHSNRGNALHELNRFEEALESYDRALELRPDFAEAHSNRGNALQELTRCEEALESYDRALMLRPDLAEAHSNRGNALKELNRFEEALASYGRALTLRPALADAHFNEAMCRMLLGDFSRGWEKYEWRWKTEQIKNERWNFTQPQWLGANEIAGKTILLHAEQGFGDTIQFCRYVPRVAERGARVVLEVPKPLHETMRTLAGTPQIIAKGDPFPDFDLHCPLLSLPLAFGTQLETIPSEVPYLSAPASKAGAWRDRFGKHDRRRIGLVWAGNPRKELPNAHRIDLQRSIAFDRLAPILQVSDCDFYSLQKGDEAIAQLRDSTLRHRVIDWTGDLHDFSDTAALIENLDLVIAVDTAVAHLTGALGKPFWLINRHNTCWRWLLDRNDSPWYPTARLFRQDATRDWDKVIARIAAALQDYARNS